MRILCTATYYAPHISGLTAVVRTVAEKLVERGHRVTVLTARHDRKLPLREILHGVTVLRVPVFGRIGKGPLMPAYLRYAFPLIPMHDAALVHLPATPIEVLAFSVPMRWLRSLPTAAVYHCDLKLPPTALNRLLSAGAAFCGSWMLRSADAIVSDCADYAGNSPVVCRFLGKTTAITPPVILPEPQPGEVEKLRLRYAPSGEPLIGFVGRWATEKGLEYLLDALPLINRKFPGTKVVSAGESGAIGEERYRTFLRARILERHASWECLGRLDPQELTNFFAACDVTVLPSINATEAFGLVQVESMLCGTPVVATDMPGVRVPVQTTGMGRLVPCRDASALGAALTEVIRDRQRYVRTKAEIARHFSPGASLDLYEALLEKLSAGRCRTRTEPPSERGAPGSISDHHPEDVLCRYLANVPPFHALVRSAEHRLLRQTGLLADPLLDLGCGDGFFASLLFRTPPLAAIDLDQASCREALARASHRHVITAGAARMPFQPACFRTVVANCVLEHIEDLDAVLRETHRVLQPGGWLLFGVPSHHFGEMLFFSVLMRRLGLPGLGRAYARWFNRHSCHAYTDPPEAWLDRLARHGFHVSRWEYYLTAGGMRVFDLAHYLSVPHLLCRKLTGKWVVFPLSLANPLFEHWLRPHAMATPTGEGPYLFFRARKVEEPGNSGDDRR